MKKIILSTALILLGAVSTLQAQTPRVPGNFIMHIKVGERMFNDLIQMDNAVSGLGWLTVPGNFTVPMNNIVFTQDEFSFDIVADEHQGPFHVKYVGHFVPGKDTFTGAATVTDDGSLLGNFTAEKITSTETPKKFELAGEQADALYVAMIGQKEDVAADGLHKTTSITCWQSFESIPSKSTQCYFRDNKLENTPEALTLMEAIAGARGFAGDVGYATKNVKVDCAKTTLSTICQMEDLRAPQITN